jgi:hypothetical protein
MQRTTGTALDISRLVSAATVNATVAKAAPGFLYGWVVSNANAAARYLKLYDLATAPTVPVMTVMVPPGRTSIAQLPAGIGFRSGIAFGLSTAAADADTGAVAAGELLVNLFYR